MLWAADHAAQALNVMINQITIIGKQRMSGAPNSNQSARHRKKQTPVNVMMSQANGLANAQNQIGNQMK